MTEPPAAQPGKIPVDDPPPPLPPFSLRIHHCAISVADLEQSIAWYRDNLGFSLEYRLNLPHIPATGAYLRRGSDRVELFLRPGADPLPPDRRDVDADLATHGTKHMALEVTDIGAAIEFLTRRGVELAIPLFDDGDVLGCFIRDNTGNVIELLEIRNVRRAI